MAHRRQFICIPSPTMLNRPIRHPNPTPGDTLRVEDSDFLPSISLAAVLLLIFISVLPVLFQSNTGFVAIRKLSNFSGRTIRFHPLLYGQPLSTQLVVERLSNTGDEGTLLAVAEDASRTLECFSINIMALLSNQAQSFIKQVGQHKPDEVIWSHWDTRIPKIFSVAVITWTKGQTPHGVILGPPSLVTGHFHLIEIKLQRSPAEEQLTVLRGSLSIAIKLLQHLYRPIPESLETFKFRNSTRSQFRVIKINGDPYLESGLVC